MSKQKRVQITVRVFPKTLERIESLMKLVEWESTFGQDINRVDIIREALRRGLEDLEKEISEKETDE